MRGNMDYLSTHLLQFGYGIATVDYYWYLDLNERTMYLDEYGRLQPDPNRFPSSNGGQGFRALSAYAHSRGLLFGIHTMRGISGAAVAAKLRVKGTNYTADEVYDPNSACPWSPVAGEAARFYSLNLSHPGGQAFYDALYAQYAEWGVDFIKGHTQLPHPHTTNASNTRAPPASPPLHRPCACADTRSSVGRLPHSLTPHPPPHCHAPTSSHIPRSSSDRQGMATLLLPMQPLVRRGCWARAGGSPPPSPLHSSPAVCRAVLCVRCVRCVCLCVRRTTVCTVTLCLSRCMR